MTAKAPRSRALLGGEWIAYAATCSVVALVVWYLSAWVLLAADDSLTLLVSAVALRAIGLAAGAGAWAVAAGRCLELRDPLLVSHGYRPSRPLRDARGRQIALLLLLAAGGIWLVFKMHVR